MSLVAACFNAYALWPMLSVNAIALLACAVAIAKLLPFANHDDLVSSSTNDIAVQVHTEQYTKCKSKPSNTDGKFKPPQFFLRIC